MSEPYEPEEEFDVKEAIAARCNEILSSSDKPDDPLWHYTGAEGCAGIVSTGEIFATHYGFTNDTSELERGETIVRKVVDELAETETDLDLGEAYKHLRWTMSPELMSEREPVYLACFTAAGGDDVSQWSGYGRRGAGYALRLGIKPPSFPHDFAMKASTMLVQVVYDEADFVKTIRRQLFRFANVYKEFSGEPGNEVLLRVGEWMERECASLSVRFKDPCFEHEQEWRLIASPWHAMGELVSFQTRDNKLVPYVKIPIGRVVKELVCGPAHAGEGAARLAGARMLLARHGYDVQIASQSELPFRG